MALATLLARSAAGEAPHLVYVPERPFNEESFLRDIRNAVIGTARPSWWWPRARRVWGTPSPFDHPVFDRPVSGGVASAMARLVEEHLGFRDSEQGCPG